MKRLLTLPEKQALETVQAKWALQYPSRPFIICGTCTGNQRFGHSANWTTCPVRQEKQAVSAQGWQELNSSKSQEKMVASQSKLCDNPTDSVILDAQTPS